MRRVRIVIAIASVAAALAAPPAAWTAGGGDDDLSSDDLLCSLRVAPNGKGKGAAPESDFTDWWFANRTAILHPKYRAAATADGKPPAEDAAARDRARTALLALLTSKDDLLVSEALLALGRAGDVRDIATLADRVADERAGWRTRRLAALGLGLLPRGPDDADARNALMAGLKAAKGGGAAHAIFWSNCAYALAMRGDAAVLSDLRTLRAQSSQSRAAATSLDPGVQGAVCYAVAALGGESVLSDVEDQLTGRHTFDGGTADAAWMAPHAANRIGAKAVKLLQTAGQDQRDLVRAATLAALGTVESPARDETAALLINAMAYDKDSLCRQTAAVETGRAGNRPSVPVLLRGYVAARPEDRPFVAVGFGLALRAFPEKRYTDQLEGTLTESTVDGERAALALACGLAKITSSSGDLLQMAMKCRGSLTAPQAAFALGLTGVGPNEREALHDTVAQNGDALARREAALALGLVHDKSVVEQLRLACTLKSSEVDRAMNLMCLGRVGSDADIDFLLGVLADKSISRQLRPCVVHALGWLLDRNEFAALGRVAAAARWWRRAPDAMYDIQHLID